jgi:hypothetical protein
MRELNGLRERDGPVGSDRSGITTHGRMESMRR